jgi:AcrR family transcriptional regulator
MFLNGEPMPPVRKTAGARRERHLRREVGAGRHASRATQRDRLIDAIVQLSGQAGYQTLSIAQISARAGVSSATFYEQFADREECLLAAYRAVAEGTMARMESSMREGEWALAARTAFGELLASLREEPDAGRLMFLEALTGGPRLLEEMRLVLDVMVASAEQLLGGAPSQASTLDIPARALLGGVRYVISHHLRTHNEDRLTELTEDMLRWVGSYSVQASRGRWSTSESALLADSLSRASDDGQTIEPPAAEPVRLPRGRHGLAPGVVARSQRARILYATASVTMAKGYASTTVADIVTAAGVAKEAFYRHFGDKEEAFLEAQQDSSQFILETVHRSYCSAADWHERVWRGLRTLLELIVENPVLSHLRLVACYTAGPAAIRRAEEFTRSFAILLDEGYGQRAEAAELPRLCSQTITGALFEVIRREVAVGAGGQLMGRLPQLTYVAIAPFLGPEAAIEALEEKIARLSAGPAAASARAGRG